MSGLDPDAPPGPALIAGAGFYIHIYTHTAPGGNYLPRPMGTSPVRGASACVKEEREMAYFCGAECLAHQSLHSHAHSRTPPQSWGQKNCTKCRPESHKYLRSVMTNRLKFNLNVETTRKKGLQRLHRLRKLSHFHVEKILRAPPTYF